MYKYTFVFQYSATRPLGYSIITYADDAFSATGNIISQMNLINKAKGRELIEIDPNDYVSSGISVLIETLNDLWMEEPIIRILNESPIYVNDGTVEDERL